MRLLIDHLITQLSNNQAGKVWVGATYDDKLKRINDKNAFIRPIPHLHSVAEIMAHLTTWQKETIRKIETGTGVLTDDADENWRTNEELSKDNWSIHLAEYKTSLATIISLLKTKEDTFLTEEYYDPDFKGRFPYSFVLNGMLHHNIYHLGQLGIVIKYLKAINKY